MFENLKLELQDYEDSTKSIQSQEGLEEWIEALCDKIQSAYDNCEITEEEVHKLMEISDIEIDM